MDYTTFHHPPLNHDDIARCAYRLWEQEGKPVGRDQEFWFMAQQQLGHAQEQAKLLAGAAGNPAKVAAAAPSRSDLPAPAPESPAARKLMAPAALPTADLQLKPRRRSARGKRRATV